MRANAVLDGQSMGLLVRVEAVARDVQDLDVGQRDVGVGRGGIGLGTAVEADRKSTRLNSSHRP